LQSLSDDAEVARAELRRARDAEVEAQQAYKAALRRAILSPECPKVRRDHCTVAERDAWVEDQCAGEELAYALAKATRQAAADKAHTLRAQMSVQQSITKSVGDAYRGSGRQPW
jgi:hypothetical protein